MNTPTRLQRLTRFILIAVSFWLVYLPICFIVLNHDWPQDDNYVFAAMSLAVGSAALVSLFSRPNSRREE